jgi:hypothetical protein
MLNRYYQAATTGPAIPIHEFRIYDDNGFELSSIENIAHQVKVYPNPTLGKLIVDSPVTMQRIELYNVNGVKQLEQYIIATHAEFKLDNLLPGIYTLVCHIEKGVYKQQIVIQ